MRGILLNRMDNGITGGTRGMRGVYYKMSGKLDELLSSVVNTVLRCHVEI